MPTNILLTGKQFAATIPSNATSIIFCNEVAPTGVSLTDVSEAKDMGIITWYDEPTTTYYVSTQRENVVVQANVNSSSMFEGKSKLVSIDLSNFRTDYVESMICMFMDCSSLVSLDLTNINTERASSLRGVFRNCKNLESITFGDNFCTESITYMGWLFDGCKTLKEIDLSNFNTTNVTLFQSMFINCDNLETVLLGDKFLTDSATNVSYMFSQCKKLKNINVSNFKMNKVTTMEAMFENCESLTELDVTNWEPDICTNMAWLCYYCTSLETFDASSWKMGKAKKLNSMFNGCSNLNGFSVAGWDMSSAENVGFMFYACKKWKSVDFEDWDVRKVQTFDHFLAHSNMQEFDVSKWEITSTCTNLYAIFHSTQVSYIDVTNWDTSNVTVFGQLFEGMSNLEKIDGLETWNTSKGIDFSEMFHACGKLKEIDLSTFDTRSANEGIIVSTNNSISRGLMNMFSSCNSLTKLTLGENFTRFGNGSISSEYYAYFPTPSSSNINGADGNWYIFDYAHYAPNDVPDLTAGTYYSSIKLVDEIDVVVKNGSLKKTADAIRTKNGNTKKYKPNEFADAILLI